MKQPAVFFEMSSVGIVLLIAMLHHERRNGYALFQMNWHPDYGNIWRLLSLGFPSAMQILFEGGVFAVVTVLVARLDEASLAAHGIAVAGDYNFVGEIVVFERG